MSDLIIPDNVKALASERVLESLELIKDNLEVLDNFQVPRVLFKDSSFAIPGLEKTDTLEAVVLAAKTTRTYYDKLYDPKAEKEGPMCSSTGGRMPTAGRVAQANECQHCEHNPLAEDYDKVQPNCKQKKVLLLHLEGASVPCILRIPATSIRSVDDALAGLLIKGLKYWHAKLRFEIYKKDQDQTYDNIKVSFIEPVESPNDLTALQLFWKGYYSEPKQQKASSDSTNNETEQEETQDISQG